jgi:hypothetical protein
MIECTIKKDKERNRRTLYHHNLEVLEMQRKRETKNKVVGKKKKTTGGDAERIRGDSYNSAPA